MAPDNKAAGSLVDEIRNLRATVESGKTVKARVDDIKQLETVSTIALNDGFTGLYEILVKPVRVHEEKTGTGLKKSDLLNLLDQVLVYLESGNRYAAKLSLLESITDSPLKKHFSDDELVIIDSLLDIPDNTDNMPSTTELDFETGEDDDDDILDSVPARMQVPDNTVLREVAIEESISGDTRGLLEIMQAELIPVEANLHKLHALLEAQAEFDLLSELCSEINTSLEIYGEAVTTFEFTGLGEIIKKAREELLVDDSNTNLKDYNSKTVFILELIDAIFSYLSNPSRKVAIEKLSSKITTQGWDKGSDVFRKDNIESALFYKTEDETAGKEKTRKIATAEDTSLEIPDDISTDLLDALLEELPDQIQELTGIIQKLSTDGTMDDIQTAKRIAHTLKGAGNTVGITGIAMMTHRLEDIFLFLFKNNIMPTGYVYDLLLRSVDCLAGMGDYLLKIGEQPENVLELLQELMDVSFDFEVNGIANSTSLKKEASRTAPDKTPASAERSAAGKSEPAKSIKVTTGFIDELLRLVGVSIIDNKQVINTLQDSIDQINLSKNIFSELRYFSNKAEEIITTKDIGRLTGNDDRASRYDALELDYYSDLHVFIQQVIEKTFDAEETTQSLLDNLLAINEKLLNIGKINYQINSTVEKNRRMPVSNHASRFERIVRQAASLSGKNVNLEIEGKDTLIDSEIFNSLAEALIHLLRNAVDHGIEDEESRVAAGKSRDGNIRLSFSTSDDLVRICVEDDGGGLNLDLIRKRAMETGLIDKNSKHTGEELCNLIFNPDFSTKSETTQLSGRGIGMDAVYTAVKKLAGDITTRSTTGKGTRFELQVPSSQMTVNAIIVGLGAKSIALATKGIEQIFYYDQAEVKLDKDTSKSVTIDEKKYDAVELESLLQLNFERRSSERTSPLLILFNMGNNRKKVVLVDRILGCENMILKSPGNYIPKLNGIMGVSVLGDGTIVPIMDATELLEMKASGFGTTRTYKARPKAPVALIVDDSLSVRRSLVEFMQDLGYRTRSANDGMDGYEIACKCCPEIIITDMEMPRMNGLELVSHLKSYDATRDIPVIMITSRSAQIHIDEAEAAGIDAYLTKPYSEEELLNIIRELSASKVSS